MKLRTAIQLKEYLKTHALSPERFSAITGVSNMTIRRWVKNDDAFEIPEKYWPLFDLNLSTSPQFDNSFAFQDGFTDLEKHVHDLGVNEENDHKSHESLNAEFLKKSEDPSVAASLVQKVKTLFLALKSAHVSNYQRTLVLGAISYFLSPFDLVPDVTPVIGYLDDYAVATMVLTSVAPVLKKEP